MSDLRIGGLATGMDIDQMVKDLMQAQNIKVERIKQKRQQVEWQRADYRTVNSSLRNLRDMVFNMKLEGPYRAKKATSSNESVVTANASVSAAPGSYAVTVSQLAQGLTKGSQVPLSDETNPDGSVRTLSQQFATLPSGTITFTLVGKVGADGVTRNEQNFTIDTTTATVNTLASEINQYSEKLGITASYDAANNRFFLTTNGTGSTYGIGVKTDSDSLLSSMTGNAADSKLQLVLQTGAAVTTGLDAEFSFGDATGLTSPNNTVTMNGITMTLKDGTPASPKTTTITVTRDTEAVYNAIKSFVEQYNKTIDLVNKELKEERYSEYLPLTESDREKLSDKQEEEWQEKAKSGMLRNDSYLSGLVSKMRSALSSVISGANPVIMDGKKVTHNSLASIGIVTGDYTDGGKLYLKNDGDDLKAAIQADPEGVMKLFRNESTVAEEKGMITRLYDEVDKGIDYIIDKAGAESLYSLRDDSVFGKKLYDMDKQIANWEDRLVRMENRYWKQYSALEKAINKLNSQSAWLSQQLGAGSK